MRARAFHILEPRGTVDMLIIFLEERSEGSHPLLDSSKVSEPSYVQILCVFMYTTVFLPTHSTYSICQDTKNRITPFLGKWKGHSVTKRSGVYGSTIAEADTVVLHEMNDNGQLIQVY
jgi:hypothetical protein